MKVTAPLVRFEKAISEGLLPSPRVVTPMYNDIPVSSLTLQQQELKPFDVRQQAPTVSYRGIDTSADIMPLYKPTHMERFEKYVESFSPTPLFPSAVPTGTVMSSAGPRNARALLAVPAHATASNDENSESDFRPSNSATPALSRTSSSADTGDSPYPPVVPQSYRFSTGSVSSPFYFPHISPVYCLFLERLRDASTNPQPKLPLDTADDLPHLLAVLSQRMVIVREKIFPASPLAVNIIVVLQLNHAFCELFEAVNPVAQPCIPIMLRFIHEMFCIISHTHDPLLRVENILNRDVESDSHVHLSLFSHLRRIFAWSNFSMNEHVPDSSITEFSDFDEDVTEWVAPPVGGKVGRACFSCSGVCPLFERSGCAEKCGCATATHCATIFSL